LTVRDEDKRLEPVVVKRASEEIYDQIRLKVMSGELKPGDRLPSEKNIMEMMHRSRATVREALRMLEGDGYIRTIPGSAGAIIQKLDTRNMEQSFDALMRVERIGVRELGELRDIIEVQTAGWAAERRTQEELDDLYKCLKWEEKYISNTRYFLMAGGERQDNGFHILMAKAAHNDFTLMIERVTYMNVRKYVEKEVMRFPIKEQAAICRQIFEKHARVITAIAEQDKEKAMDEMRQRTVPFISDEYIEDYMDR